MPVTFRSNNSNYYSYPIEVSDTPKMSNINNFILGPNITDIFFGGSDVFIPIKPPPKSDNSDKCKKEYNIFMDCIRKNKDDIDSCSGLEKKLIECNVKWNIK